MMKLYKYIATKPTMNSGDQFKVGGHKYEVKGILDPKFYYCFDIQDGSPVTFPIDALEEAFLKFPNTVYKLSNETV